MHVVDRRRLIWSKRPDRTNCSALCSMKRATIVAVYYLLPGHLGHLVVPQLVGRVSLLKFQFSFVSMNFKIRKHRKKKSPAFQMSPSRWVKSSTVDWKQQRQRVEKFGNPKLFFPSSTPRGKSAPIHKKLALKFRLEKVTLKSLKKKAWRGRHTRKTAVKSPRYTAQPGFRRIFSSTRSSP